MGSEWEETTLGDIAEIIDSRHKTPNYTEFGMPMVRVVDIKGGALNLTETKKVSQVDYIDYSKGRDPEVGDLIISRVGSYGNISYVNDGTQRFCLGQNTALIIPKINWQYLYYQLISPAIKRQIEELVVGAVQKTISLKNIKSIKIQLPPLPEQKAIAHILSSLDDKIELNRQMNATLEGLAQALFQSWFVDFDPVLDNALTAGNSIPDELSERAAVRRQALDNGTANREAAQHFPDSFQLTEELGWIPEGWEVGCIADLCSTVTDGSHHSPKSVDEKSGLPMASSKDLTGLGINYESCRFISKEDFTDLERNGCSPNLGDVLIAKDGARCGETCCIHRNEAPVVLLSSVAILRPNSPNLSTFLNALMSRAESVADLRENYVSGSAIPRIILRDFKRFPVIKFPSPILEKWALYSQHLHQRATDSHMESETLTKLRDTLLPQLISGELRIPDAAKLAEAALA